MIAKKVNIAEVCGCIGYDIFLHIEFLFLLSSAR